MASFILSRSLSLLVLFLIVIALFSRISISEAKLSFSFTNLGKNSTFESEDIALYGDAKLVDGGSSISFQLNDDSVSHGGGGRVVYKKPIEYTETKSEIDAGFSTSISFSVSRNRGGRLGFVVFPVNGTIDHSFFKVKFDISEDFTKFKDPNVTVIVDGTTDSKKIRNLAIANVEKKEKLVMYALINYLGGGKFIEVRLSKSERINYAGPMVLYRIDLSEMLKDEDEFMVGLNSDSGNISLHSWSLKVRRVSKSVHSYAPVFLENLRKEEEEEKRRRTERMWEVVTCFVMTFGSTGLVFFAMMHIWAAFRRNNLVIEECGLKTKEFAYEKMEKVEVVMSKAEVQQAKK